MRALASTLAFTLLVLWTQPLVADEEPVMGNAPFIVPQEELPRLKHEALDGSPDAAQRLYNHYRMIVLDPNEAVRWAQISAENGNPIGQYSFGLELLERKDEVSTLRGKFWMRRAAEQGDSRAREVLDELEKRERTR